MLTLEISYCQVRDLYL